LAVGEGPFNLPLLAASDLRGSTLLLVVVVVVVVVVVMVVEFVSQVYIAPTYAHIFLTISTNYDIWLIAGETQFTHATQDPNHGAPQSQGRLNSHMFLTGYYF